MSKPISFGFAAKSKAAPATSPLATSNPSAPKSITFTSVSKVGRNPLGASRVNSKVPALHEEYEDEDEAPPKHEELTGFTSTGAILSKPKEEKVGRVIENPGNGDWRKRGKNLLPQEVQAARNGEGPVTVERDEASKAYGLQFADKEESSRVQENEISNAGRQNAASEPQRELTEDERALAALLDDGTGKPKSTATIAVQGNESWQRSEIDDFSADFAMRPDSSTLDQYAAIPVEEFGIALLRGMGRKRRANGEVIDSSKGQEEEKKRKDRTNQGLLGIGAKPVKGLEGVELGAWGKSDMRKNARGEGFFTPVIIEDKTRGENAGEKESERRKKAAKILGKEDDGEEDWRDRRDRNLEKNGRDKSNGEGNLNGSRKRDRSERDGATESSPRSRRNRDRELDEREYDNSRSRKDRSRSRDRRKRDYDYEQDDKTRERWHSTHRDKYRDGDRYDSSSSKRSEHRHRDRDRGDDRDRHRDRNRDGDDRRHRDRK